jgi:hypothetical protein
MKTVKSSLSAYRLPMGQCSPSAWREMKACGYWLTSADQFLVEIAATLTARYRLGQLTHGHVSVMIGLLGKLGFSPRERGALNLPTRTT